MLKEVLYDNYCFFWSDFCRSQSLCWREIWLREIGQVGWFRHKKSCGRAMTSEPNHIFTSPLTGREGALVSVSIDIDPRDLESLLGTLAEIDFPISPQIYHNACFVYYHDNGNEHIEPATLVEFPAYAGQLDRLRNALRASNFDPGRLTTTDMLQELHSRGRLEAAPPGALYRARQRCKHAELAHNASVT